MYGKSSEANGNIVLGITQAQCPLLVEETRIYKKAAGSLALNTLGGGKRIGSWVPAGEFLPAHCELRPDSAYKPVPTQVPPVSGTDLYRVTVSTKLGTIYRLVTAGAVHVPVL